MTESTHDRASALESDVQNIHVPEPTADREALLLRAGAAITAIGVALIGAAWYRASGTPYVADQIPMLISGGVLGLAFVLIGAGLWVRFSLARLLRVWLARDLLEQQVQTDRIVEALARLEPK